MNIKPLVSVVVPIYNAETYLHDCIESILSQTYSNIECLLIDDGSEDDSGKICDYFKSLDRRIIVVHKENGGVMSARAEGVRRAGGEWICFVDADDTIAPDALECMYSCISENIDIVVLESQADICYSVQLYIQLLFSFQQLALWGKLYRRYLLNDYVLSIPAKFKVGEDFICQLRLLCGVKRNIWLCSEKKYIYNTNNINSVQRSHKKSYEYEVSLLDEVADIMEKMPFVDDFVKIAYLKWRIVYLGGMIGLRYPVDYESRWVVDLENESKKYTLTVKECLIIKAIRVPFLRIFLIAEKLLKGLIRRLINNVKRNHS